MNILRVVAVFTLMFPMLAVDASAQSQPVSELTEEHTTKEPSTEYLLDSFIVTYKDEQRGTDTIYLSDTQSIETTSDSQGLFAAAADSSLNAKMLEYSQLDEVEAVQPNYIYRTSWTTDFDTGLDWPGDMSTNGGNFAGGLHWYYELGNLRGMWFEQGCGMGDPDCGGSSDVLVAVIDTGLGFESFTAQLRGDSYGPYSEISDPPAGINLSNNIGEMPDDPFPNRDTNKLDDDSNGYIDDWRGLDSWVYDFCYPVELDDPPCTLQEWGDEGHPNDDNGHGTFVTGLIASLIDNSQGISNSVSPASNVRILPIKANFPQSNAFTTSSLIAGIDYAILADADVINMSLSGGIDDSALHSKIQDADTAGIFVVAASGNSNGAVEYPASYSEVFAVGAVNEDGTRSCYSNYGSALDVVAYVGDGEDTYGCYSPSRVYSLANSVWQGSFPCFFTDTCDGVGGDFSNYQLNYSVGTSFAAPQVSALAALLLSVDPSLTNSEIATYITDNADNSVGTAGDDLLTGDGAVDFQATIADIISDQGDAAPSVTVTDPVGSDDSADTTYSVSWNASDADSTEGEMRMNIYIDTDTDSSSVSGVIDGCENGDIGTVLGSGLSCTADLSSYTDGIYYLLACVRDDFTTVCDYSDSLQIGNTAAIDNGVVMATTTIRDVYFSTSFSTPPTVIAEIRSEYGADQTYAHVSDVTTSGFKLVLQENTRTGYDNVHTPEEVSWFAVENATSEIAIGEVTTDRDLGGANPGGWQYVEFSVPFSSTPIVLAEPQVQNGADLEYHDIKNVSTDGFFIRMEELPGYDGNHINETFGWIAFEDYAAGESGIETGVNNNWKTVTFDTPYSAPPMVLAEIQTETGGEQAIADIKNVSRVGFQVRVAEDPRAYNPVHSNEQVGWLAVERPSTYESVMQTELLNHNVRDIVFDEPLDDRPVVIADIQTEGGWETADVDITTVNRGYLRARLEEDPKQWNVVHGDEVVAFYAQIIDEPDKQSAVGTQEGGLTNVNSNWTQVNFESSFSSVPFVFADIQTEYGGDTANVDIRNITTSGFQIRVEEDVFAGWDGFHTTEVVGWIAFETPNAGSAGAITIDRQGLLSKWVTIDGSTTPDAFGPFGGTPIVFAEINSESGSQTVQIDLKSITTTSADIAIEEERNYDNYHIPETFVWWGISFGP